MTISDRTRKILWGRAANRCAICKCELVMDATDRDEESVVGDECHIVARQAGGPRSDNTKTPEELDHYKNLILLCRVHHKMIDDQPQTHTVEVLEKLKADHERWVETRLKTERDRDQAQKRNQMQFATLPRITDAKDVIDIVSVADISWTDYETPEDTVELSAITEFLGEFEGISFLSDEPVYLAEARFRIKQQLEALETMGYYVYGKLVNGKLEIMGETIDCKIEFIVLKRFDLPHITIGYYPSISF